MTRLFPDKALFSGAAVARCSIPFVCVSCVIVLGCGDTTAAAAFYCLLSLVASPLVSSTIISPGLILPPFLLAPFPLLVFLQRLWSWSRKAWRLVAVA